VGGFNSQQKNIGQDGVIFTPVARERQAAAVKFLGDNAFVTPAFFIKPEILRRIEAAGVIDRVRNAQRSVLNNLMSPARLARLVEQETVDGKDGKPTYAPTEFLADVRNGVFKELAGTGPVKINAFRRNLQRSYVEIMNERLNRPAAAAMPIMPGATAPLTTEDVRPFFRGELKVVSATITAALPRATDRETRLHLEDIKDQIAKVLDPRFATPAAAGAAGASRGFDLDQMLRPTTCWPDYQIKR